MGTRANRSAAAQKKKSTLALDGMLKGSRVESSLGRNSERMSPAKSSGEPCRPFSAPRAPGPACTAPVWRVGNPAPWLSVSVGSHDEQRWKVYPPLYPAVSAWNEAMVARAAATASSHAASKALVSLDAAWYSRLSFKKAHSESSSYLRSKMYLGGPV